MTLQLPKTCGVAELAEALGWSESYVAAKARSGEWPHLRGARGSVRFTQEDVEEVVRLCRPTTQSRGATTFLTSRSQQALSRRRTSS